MPNDRWFERLEDTLIKKGLAHYAAPLRASADVATTVQVRPFGPYQDEDDNWLFSTGLHLEVSTESTARWLYAMTTGSMEYHSGTGGGPGTVILTRGDAAGTALTHDIGSLPHWYPHPRYIVYENVDPDDAKHAALQALMRKNETKLALERLKKAKGNSSIKAGANKLAEMWLRGEIPQGLTVLGGDLVGGCGVGPTAGTLFAEVRMVEQLDPAPTRFYNPSYYIALWHSTGWLTGGNALLKHLADTGGPPTGTGKLLFVWRDSPSEEPPYSGPETASHTIAAAVNEANNGDTILILHPNIYAEQLVIEKPISITSTGQSLKLAFLDGAPAPPTVPDYPTLEGENTFRPLIFRNINDGIAHVGKVIIKNGKANSKEVEGDLVDRGDGGGILVERTDNVVISSCIVRDCRALGGGFFGEGFGGGISAYHASPAIVGCHVVANEANSRGNGVGVFGYGWPAMLDCWIRFNTPIDGESNPRHDGGGIGITIAVTNTEDVSEFIGTNASNLHTRWHLQDLNNAFTSFVRIVRCNIGHNEAWDDGGGVYISVASLVSIRDTTLLQNKARRDGGGIRVTFGSVLRLVGCTILYNASNSNLEAKDEGGTGGGGISSRNAHLIKIQQTEVTGNRANGWAGGGLYFISSDEGALSSEVGGDVPGLPEPDFDWNNILLHPVIYAHTDARLWIDSASVFKDNEATQLDGQDNHGKGGAVYILRWKGSRRSGLGPLEGQSVHVYIADVDVLKPTNDGSFPNADRLYIDDLVKGTPEEPHVEDDGSLPAGGPYLYESL